MDYKKKAMAYDEALERAKKATQAGGDVAMDIIQYIFPQLKESEDEKIRKAIHIYLDWLDGRKDCQPKGDYTIRDMITYLEKQKANSDVELSPEDYKFLPQELISVCNDIIAGRPVLLCADNTGAGKLRTWLKQLIEKQKEQNLNPSKSVGLKEQKPADDKAFEEWIDDWWKHNKVNNPDSYDKGDEIQFDERSFKNFCRGIRNMYQQKPNKQEWGEEDEEMLNSCISSIEESKENRYAYKENDGDTSYDREVDWLKSLSPQPKQEIYQSAKHDLAIKFMNYLDENRPDGKMGLSNGECEDIDKAFNENDWAKILRYAEKYGKKN